MRNALNRTHEFHVVHPVWATAWPRDGASGPQTPGRQGDSASARYIDGRHGDCWSFSVFAAENRLAVVMTVLLAVFFQGRANACS